MRKQIAFRLTAAAIILLLAGLPACSNDDDPATPGSGATTIGPSGGTVTGGGGNVELVFPPGAVATEIDVTIDPASSPPQDDGMILNRAYDFGPDGTQFQVPVPMTITYDPADIPAGVTETDLRLCQAAGGSWSQLAGSTVDTQAHEVSGEVTSFSVYGPGVPAGTGTSPYAGTFIITATLTFNDCDVPALIDDLYTITIEGSTFNFGEYQGTWYEETTRGFGTTPEITNPINPPDCYGYYTVEFYVVYSDYDHFTGHFLVHYRFSEGCPYSLPCSYNYDMVGTRNR